MESTETSQEIPDENYSTLPFSHQDPLGLNDLTESQGPTYNYSLDDGLHNFVIPVSSNSSSQYVIASNSFSLAPIAKKFKQDQSATSTSQSFTLVPNDKVSKLGAKLQKETRTIGPLNKIRNQELDVRLECEWEECSEVFDKLHAFLDHVAFHVTDVPIISTKITSEETNKEGYHDLVDDGDGQKTFGCLWQGCGFETTDSGEIIRHLNFHSFHTKIKSNASLILEETKINRCTLSRNQRNVLPQLPECDFLCQWDGCDKPGEVFSEPIKFYWHVQWHAEEYRPSKLAFGKKSTEKVKKIEILCRWANCSFKAGTTFKLKDHLKSHSAERTVACPDCGGLFASRSKFFDHCTRQLKVDKGLKCSYCQKTFPTERLLRDHMRSHINHFQCPLCNMTCPSATALNKHVTYRHTDERAFVCPFKAEEEDEEDSCDYSAKTQNDLNKHLRNVHYSENIYKCNDKECPKVFRTQTSLKFHIEKVHENIGPKYCCHLCKKRFRRGNYLTAHLATVHDYKWPPGHKKFHYAMNENGLYHVQTMRFESFDLPNASYVPDEAT